MRTLFLASILVGSRDYFFIWSLSRNYKYLPISKNLVEKKTLASFQQKKKQKTKTPI